jgi:hypothetical protein
MISNRDLATSGTLLSGVFFECSHQSRPAIPQRTAGEGAGGGIKRVPSSKQHAKSLSHLVTD